MRTVLLSFALCTAFGTAAFACEPCPEPISAGSITAFESDAQTYGPTLAEGTAVVSYDYVATFQERPRDTVIDLESDRPSIAIGNGWRIEGEGDSYYPFPNQKIRDEGLYLAYPLTDRVTFEVGGWRSKLKLQEQSSFRSEYYGFQVTRR